jgi:hypothetical protein
MTDLTLQTLPINGIQMRVATQGSGRLGAAVPRLS